MKGRFLLEKAHVPDVIILKFNNGRPVHSDKDKRSTCKRLSIKGKMLF